MRRDGGLVLIPALRERLVTYRPMWKHVDARQRIMAEYAKQLGSDLPLRGIFRRSHGCNDLHFKMQLIRCHQYHHYVRWAASRLIRFVLSWLSRPNRPYGASREPR